MHSPAVTLVSPCTCVHKGKSSEKEFHNKSSIFSALQQLAWPFLRFLRLSSNILLDLLLLFLLSHLDLVPYRSVHRELKHIVDTLHLFAAALYICGTHSHCNSLALVRRYGCQALCSEKINTSAFRAKVGFETDKDKRSCRAEVKNLGVPLVIIQLSLAYENC